MSGLFEVIGGIGAVISILEASKETWESAEKDINLPKTFVEVARRLPVLQDTLRTCHDQLKPLSDSIPKSTIDAFEKTLETTISQARALREIFEDTIPGSDDKRMERYKKAVNRVAKGKRVEQLMNSMSEDAKQLANYHAVKSARPDLMQKLDKLIEDLHSLDPSLPSDQQAGDVFNAYGSKQYNNTRHCQQFNYDDVSGTQHSYLSGAHPPKAP